MKKLSLNFYFFSIVALAVSTVTFVGCTKNNNTNDQTGVQSVIANWPATSKKVAEEMIAKYGQPGGSTTDMLVWNNNAPWKRTIVYRDTVAHNFPTPHPDLLQQFIDYKVPVDKYSIMAAYDGSVIVERTKGEISARCDKEGANLLAINLANDVATGAKTADAARAYYTQAMQKFITTGQMDPYMQGFKFTVPTSGTKDPDVKNF
jgi:hypothetical protein